MTTTKESAGAERIKMLVVEDDKFLQRVLAMKLTSEGFEVSSANDGEEALKILHSGDLPQVILFDLIMPKMDGFEVLTVMKTEGLIKKIPVIVISNLGQDEDIKRAKDLGASDFLVKAKISLHVIAETIKETYARLRKEK